MGPSRESNTDAYREWQAGLNQACARQEDLTQELLGEVRAHKQTLTQDRWTASMAQRVQPLLNLLDQEYAHLKQDYHTLTALLDERRKITNEMNEAMEAYALTLHDAEALARLHDLVHDTHRKLAACDKPSLPYDKVETLFS